METHWLSGKEKVPVTAVSKGDADSRPGDEKTHHLISLKKVQL